MEERSGNGSTYRSLILVHLASVEVGRATRADTYTDGTLHAESKHHVTFQRGAGGKVYEGSKCEQPPPAHRQGTGPFQRGAGVKFREGA